MSRTKWMLRKDYQASAKAAPPQTQGRHPSIFLVQLMSIQPYSGFIPMSPADLEQVVGELISEDSAHLSSDTDIGELFPELQPKP